MRTILLIDDEPAMGSLVESWVADMEMRVVQASGLREGLRAAERERPHAVLLDLALGDEDGLAILPDLMAAPALENVPVIAFSVHNSREREAFEKGVEAFVAKPFRSGDLRTALSEVIT